MNARWISRANASSRAAATTDAGQPPRDLLGMARAEEQAHVGDAEDLVEDLAAAEERLALDPFRHASSRARGGAFFRIGAAASATERRWSTGVLKTTRSAPRTASERSLVSRTASGMRMPGRNFRFSRRRRISPVISGKISPERRAVPVSRQQARQRRPPAAVAEQRYVLRLHPVINTAVLPPRHQDTKNGEESFSES